MIFIFGKLNAQNISRDPDTRKDFANVFYKQQYTLFDLWSDEPIFPDKSGMYNIYYTTNENRTPKSYNGTPSQLQGMSVYKFKNYNNCKYWCDGYQYKRDPDSRKDFANVFYKQQYTLFDLWSDEPVFPDKSGMYNIYYTTNENRTPKSYSGTPSQLQGMSVYKFKDYNNCKNWCDGVTYDKKNESTTIVNNSSNSSTKTTTNNNINQNANQSDGIDDNEMKKQYKCKCCNGTINGLQEGVDKDGSKLNNVTLNYYTSVFKDPETIRLFNIGTIYGEEPVRNSYDIMRKSYYNFCSIKCSKICKE